jgi:hypothetical protein
VSGFDFGFASFGFVVKMHAGGMQSVQSSSENREVSSCSQKSADYSDGLASQDYSTEFKSVANDTISNGVLRVRFRFVYSIDLQRLQFEEIKM